jgi:uncharacterized sporulation protein YeaH/YhbH (DUF444 family)
MARVIDRTKDLEEKKNKSYLESAEHQKIINKAIEEKLYDLLTETILKEKGGAVKIRISKMDPGFYFGNEIAGEASNDEAGGDVPGKYDYEINIDQEKILDQLFKKLKLPVDIFRRLKKMDSRIALSGLKVKGPAAMLHRRSTWLAKKKREKALNKLSDYRLEDRRYYGLASKIDYSVKGVAFFIRDKSGSMEKEKVVIIKALMLLIYRFLKFKYSDVEVVFIAHDEAARQVNEQEFFEVLSEGGTAMSSGLKLAEEIIRKKYSSGKHNIYIFHFGDGENNSFDNEIYLHLLAKMKKQFTCFGYLEVGVGMMNYLLGLGANTGIKMATMYDYLLKRFSGDKKMKSFKVHKLEEIGKIFVQLFEGR